MGVLAGRVPENTARNKGGDRQLAVSKALQWNTGRAVQEETGSRRMGYENLQWRKELIADTLINAKQCLPMNDTDRIKKFGTKPTIFMTTTERVAGNRFERTITHTGTRVSTGTKVAARKIKGEASEA